MTQTTQPSQIKPMQARAYVPNMQMRQVMEKLKEMPKPIHVTSNVSNFRYLDA